MNNALDTVQKMEVGSEVFLNMFQGGGSLVERVGEDMYYLSEIPLYGGGARFYGSFRYKSLPTLVDVVFNEFV